MPTVTVIIPVYKVERYLDACVESVVRQSYADLEILLVDDGSPDRCPALCDAWAEKDPRIKVIHRENGGLSAARNSGIDAAMGEFLLFVDSDDLLEPDAVRRAVDARSSCQRPARRVRHSAAPVSSPARARVSASTRRRSARAASMRMATGIGSRPRSPIWKRHRLISMTRRRSASPRYEAAPGASWRRPENSA